MGARLLIGAIAAVTGIALAIPMAHAATGWSASTALPGLGNGAVWSVAVSPTDANSLVAATDQGIYRTSDGGANWSHAAAPAIRVWTVGFDLRNPTHLFAGTSTQGILASVDGGATWVNQSAGLPDLNVRSLAFSLSQIVAGTDSGVAVSGDGKTWGRGGLDGVSISALTVVSNAPALVLMAGTDTGDLTQGFLWTNAGNAWTADHGTGLPSTAAVSSLASGPVTTAAPHRPIIVDTSQGTFRSVDSGQTWSPATGLPQVGTQTLVLTAVTISPLDPGLVYSGADAGGSPGGAVMRSTDTGLTYADISSGIPDQKKNVVSITVAPTTPPIVYAAVSRHNGASVVYKLTDAGAPTPPTLTAESPGAVIPVAVGTPTATPRPKVSSTPTAVPSPTSTGLVGTIFHWPMPLVVELIVVLLIAYGILRWRQRAYVEGPP